MPFNTALSGIRAASTDLRVTGNNIANASTTGFKASRTEFGDTSVLGSGSNAAGAGVQVQDVAQRFTQGNLTFTESEMDLAINGNGFFVVSQNGESLYTRAGSFGVDSDGFIVSNTGARLQGFSANESGSIGDIQGDMVIETSNLAPIQTTQVSSILNLDASDEVLQSTGRRFVNDGNVVGVAQVGLQSQETSAATGAVFTLPLGNDAVSAGNINFNDPTEAMEFTVQLSGSSGNNGSVDIRLDTASGVPATVTNLNELRKFVSVINAQLLDSSAPDDTPIDVQANLVEDSATPGNYQIVFSALQGGEASSINITPTSANTLSAGLSDGAGNETMTEDTGESSVSNGYNMQSVDITNPDGDVVTYTSGLNASAVDTAEELNSILGLTATASTVATLSDYPVGASDMLVELNGVVLSGNSLNQLEEEINNATNNILPGFSAVHDEAAGTLTITSAKGDDIRISISGTNDGDSISVQGNLGADTQVLEIDSNDDGFNTGTAFDALSNSVVIGGVMEITLDEGYSIGNESPLGQLFQLLGDSSDPNNTVFDDVVINAFDPTDQDTYNRATSMAIYDSFGNSHIMTQYFVKQPFDINDATTSPNHWQVHILVDGENVGDPAAGVTGIEATIPTQATFNIFFNDDGTLNETVSEDVEISNWTPLNDASDPNGSIDPNSQPISSDFVVDFDGTTQFGADFSVNSVDQNGFATGRLSGLSIDDGGIIFARFSNGESQVLGQIVLADFTNQEGLQPVGNNMWAENFSSGSPNVSTPNSAALGSIRSGALEESNVDLSEQLVNLIIAQRNFQASSKTIETASAITQTIINLR